MGRKGILRPELKYLHSLFIYERHGPSGSHLRVALVCRRPQLSLGDCLSDFHAALPAIPEKSGSMHGEGAGRSARDQRSAWSITTAACLFSADEPVPKTAGKQEGVHTAALTCYWSQMLLLLPMGTYTAELCSANAQCISQSRLLE